MSSVSMILLSQHLECLDYKHVQTYLICNDLLIGACSPVIFHVIMFEFLVFKKLILQCCFDEAY